MGAVRRRLAEERALEAAAGPGVPLDRDAEGAAAVEIFWGRRKAPKESWDAFFAERRAHLSAQQARYLEDLAAGKYDDPAFLRREAEAFDRFDRAVNAAKEGQHGRPVDFPVSRHRARRPKAEQLPWMIEDEFNRFDSDLEEPWPEDLSSSDSEDDEAAAADAEAASDSSGDEGLYSRAHLGARNQLYYYNERYRQMKRAENEKEALSAARGDLRAREEERRLEREVQLAEGRTPAELSPARRAGTEDALGREIGYFPEKEQFTHDGDSDLEFTPEEQRARANYVEDVKAFGYGKLDDGGRDERDSVSKDFAGGLGPVTLLEAAKDEYDWTTKGHWWEQAASDNEDTYAYQVEDRGQLDDTYYGEHTPDMIVQDRYHDSDDDEEDPDKAPLSEYMSDTFGPVPNDPVANQQSYQPDPDWNSTIDPQVSLWATSDPYAPFPISTLMWESFKYDDGSMFEGLSREGLPHGYGTLTLGTMPAGNLKGANSAEGAKYEGMFRAGYVHGMGQMTLPDGKLFKGEWNQGKKHGCGVAFDYLPYMALVEKGVSPDEAWAQTKDLIDTGATWGTWWKDEYVSEPKDDLDAHGVRGRVHTHLLHPNDVCDRHIIRGVLQELDSVVMRARMFQHKPNDEVMLHKTDVNGTPIPAMQDPLYYPTGTKWMAPGPLGQVFSLPADEGLREHLRRVARNYKRIYRMYNFPWDTDVLPDGDLAKAQEYWPEECFTDGPNSAFWFNKVVAPLEKEITEDIQFHTDRDSLDYKRKGFRHARNATWKDRIKDLAVEVWSGFDWLQVKDRDGERTVEGLDEAGREVLRAQQRFLEDLDVKHGSSASKFVKEMYKKESMRKSAILDARRDRGYRRVKRQELDRRIAALKETFYSLSPTERREENFEILSDVVDFGMLKDFMKTGAVVVTGEDGDAASLRKVESGSTAALAALDDMDWEAPAELKPRKYMVNPLVDPVTTAELDDPEQRRVHQEVLNYLYNVLPRDEDSVKMLFTNKQLENLGLEPARYITELEQRYKGVYGRWSAQDRALWDRLEEEHGANDVQKVSEMFWTAKAKDNWMELRESLNYVDDAKPSKKSQRWANLLLAQQRLDEALLPLLTPEYEEMVSPEFTPQQLREQIARVPELREEVDAYLSLYNSMVARQSGGLLAPLTKGTWLRRIGIPGLARGKKIDEDWQREETVRERLEGLRKLQYQKVMAQARKVRRKGGYSKPWEDLAREVSKEKTLEDIDRELGGGVGGESEDSDADDDDEEVQIFQNFDEELSMENKFEGIRRKMLDNVKKFSALKDRPIFRPFGRRKYDLPQSEAGAAAGAQAALDFDGTADWRRKPEVQPTDVPPAASMALSLGRFSLSNSLSRQAKRASRSFTGKGRRRRNRR